jgi:hypothetical protein
MSYYDPWAHTFWLVFNRFVLFIGLSLALSSVLWCTLLQRYFGVAAWPALRSAWDILQGAPPPYWALLFWSTVANSTLFTAAVFIPLLRFGQLVRGDRHRRGARVVGNDDRQA